MDFVIYSFLIACVCALVGERNPDRFRQHIANLVIPAVFAYPLYRWHPWLEPYLLVLLSVWVGICVRFPGLIISNKRREEPGR